MYKFILAILFCFGLSACVPALVVGGAAAGGAVIYNKRSFKTMLHDRSISSSSSYQIRNDPELVGQTRISIATYNGIVLMFGNAQTQAAKDRAQAIVAAQPYVRRVYDEVIVGPSPNRRTRAHSAIITSQVRASMLTTPGLRSTQIKVVTDNKVVYLMGWVSHSQARMAADVARRVSGVRKVVKVFEYED